jgi:Paraquat-inducible protein A
MVDSNKIQADVPGYSAKIMAEVTSPSSYHRIENIADTAVKQIGKKTYDSSTAVTKKTMDSIFVTYNVHDKESFDTVNAAFLAQIKKQTYAYCFGMLGCILFIILMWWIVRNKKEVHATLYVLSVFAALILLLVGLTTTMIEIDARIATMDFHFLGQSVSFKNQELFFQSKSIIDVVVLLLKTGKVDSEIVGVMIMCFSVLFPFMKLVSTGLSINTGSKLAKNKVIHYFAFESGKWSMADVMVVAILMTFIGFNGIVENTLSDLNIHDQSVTSITTNNTSIQPGYIIFIGFVLFGFILSIILKRITGAAPKSIPKKQIG